MSAPLIYVCAPFRGPSAYFMRLNMHSAERLGFAVIQAGATPLVPHMAFGPYFGALDEERAMGVCLRMVGECDAVYCPAFRHATEGMAAELEEAARLNKPVVTTLGGLGLFMAGQRGLAEHGTVDGSGCDL